MKWIKKGKIIEAQPRLWWMQTHAMVPTVDRVNEEIYRVYFSGRDINNRSRIGYVTIGVNKGKIDVLNYSPEPIFDMGELGCFDDNGVTPSWILNHNNQKYLYYIGWNPGSTVRLSLMIGLAISKDDGVSFKRYSRAPILERTNLEPFSIITGPCVIKEDNVFKMWYVSCEGWRHRDLPLYNIKYAESNDGKNWIRKNHVCIHLKNDQETALARPCVIKNKESYTMWFSYKDPDIGYRIGYAESADGKTWERLDSQAGIDTSTDGWDSEMIEYGYIFSHAKMTYILYNGNNYGESGIGYAVLEASK